MFLVSVFPGLLPKGIATKQNVHGLCVSLQVQQEPGLFVQAATLEAVSLGRNRTQRDR